ncbi:Arabinose efflux permease (plasmid) [Rubrobacter radiotolerans]|uniref:Arabinose efflux permease n=1 Tax=Rubrobacter radiotolerans TaxID=42256 RepID=A0A023X7Q7_RUBRA|nr:MFS transporter [Rubrobacter radiotolerans]AHY48084.1 Arabinose efflux permease [Rubrobacter radiotolerans]MDX5895359.1 MFS transporter [Rubrobacter radiotolerans]SMC01699.1 Predicted arabinose efflux permease, MFS family [Rubrobacter radiotolerans DSM 5868]
MKGTRKEEGAFAGTWRLGLAGFFAIAVAFGPARSGFGLFLPDFRREFGLSTEVSGVIAGGSYGGYLVALSLVGLFATRFGPRLFVTVGGISATAGMILVALAPNAPLLAAGLILSASYAGWSWSAYNDAVEREVPSRLRGRVLSAISTGTTFGLAMAGLIALAAGVWGLPWRAAWLGFAAAALAVTVWNAKALPGGPQGPGSAAPPRAASPGWLLRPGSAVLFGVALSFGVVSGFYWTFAVDLISRSGVLPPEAGPAFYIVLGIAGFVGLLTGDAIVRFGLRSTLAACFVSLGVVGLSLGFAPAAWVSVGVSAVSLGAGIMCTSALLSVWSSLHFPERPSAGFSAVLLFLGTGTIVGPVVLGAFAGRSGLDAAFLVAGALALLTALVAGLARTPEDTSVE